MSQISELKSTINISHKDLAKLFNVSESTVIRWDKNDDLIESSSLLVIDLLFSLHENLLSGDYSYIDRSTAMLIRYYSKSNRILSNIKILPKYEEIDILVKEIYNNDKQIIENDNSILNIKPIFLPVALVGLTKLSFLAIPFLPLLPLVGSLLGGLTTYKKNIMPSIELVNDELKTFKLLLYSTADLGLSSLMAIYRYKKIESNLHTIKLI